MALPAMFFAAVWLTAKISMHGKTDSRNIAVGKPHKQQASILHSVSRTHGGT